MSVVAAEVVRKIDSQSLDLVICQMLSQQLDLRPESAHQLLPLATDFLGSKMRKLFAMPEQLLAALQGLAESVALLCEDLVFNFGQVDLKTTKK